jgi:hypothetical protein
MKTAAIQKSAVAQITHDRDELVAGRMKKRSEIVNLGNPDAIIAGLNQDTDEALSQGIVNEAHAAAERLDAVESALSKALKVPEIVTDFEKEKARIDAVVTDPKYSTATDLEKKKDTAIKDAQHKYWDYNLETIHKEQQLFLNDAKNGDYPAASLRQEKNAPVRDRLVREYGGKEIDPDKVSVVNTWFRDPELFKWQHPDGVKNSELQKQIEEDLKIQMMDWENFKIDGAIVLQALQDNREFLPYTTYNSWVNQILSGDDKNHDTESALKRLDEILNNSAPKKDDLEKLSRDDQAKAIFDYGVYRDKMKGNIISRRIRGEKDLLPYIESVREIAVSDNLSKVVIGGNVGTRGILESGSADKTFTEWSYFAANGDLDIYLDETFTRDGAKRSTVGDLDDAIPKYIEWGKNKANSLFESSGSEVRIRDMGEMETKENGDPVGFIKYTGTDGKLYRLNAGSPAAPLYLDVFENGRWVPKEKEMKRTPEDRNQEANRRIRNLDSWY